MGLYLARLTHQINTPVLSQGKRKRAVGHQGNVLKGQSPSSPGGFDVTFLPIWSHCFAEQAFFLLLLP